MDDSQQSSFAPSRSRSVAGDFRGGVQSAGPSDFVYPGGDGGSGGRGSTGAASFGGSGGPCGPGAVGGFGARDILGGDGRPKARGDAGDLECPCCHGGAGVISTPEAFGTFVRPEVTAGGPDAHSSPAGRGEPRGAGCRASLGAALTELADVAVRLATALHGVQEILNQRAAGIIDPKKHIEQRVEEAVSASEQGEEVIRYLRIWKHIHGQELFISNYRKRILEKYRRIILQAKSRFCSEIPARPHEATD